MATDQKRRSDAGFISVEMMGAVLFSLLTFTFLCNFIFIQYGRGVIRASADEGARAGSRVDASAEVCRLRAQSILDNLGGMATAPSITCSVDPGTQRISATVVAAFEPWMPFVPVISSTATATSVKEATPT